MNDQMKSIKLWPPDYAKRQNILKGERFIMRNAEANFKKGHMVTGIDPIGLSSDTVHMGFYLSPGQGLVTYSVIQEPVDCSGITEYIEYTKMVEKKIYERLLDSRVLIVRSGDGKILKFPYRHIILFTGETYEQVIKKREELLELDPYAAYRFFAPFSAREKVKYLKDLKIFTPLRMPYDKTFKEITELETKAVFERLAPEYTVVMNERIDIPVEEAKDQTVMPSLKITGKETDYSTFLLDDYQVKQVNDMGTGHRLILANPGAGKSVLLLSKAFKYASMYKSSNNPSYVLLTCFNKNLADSYKFKKDCAGFRPENRLFIMTFHKLVKELYEKQLHRTCKNAVPTSEEIEECIIGVKKGIIKLRFKAIFIDEVQIFEPQYLELCYALLEKSEDASFLMAGDLNQSVRKQSKRGDAPWKKLRDVKLDFTGRVRYIEKNYRNTRQIGDYLSRMLTNMNRHMADMDMPQSEEYDYNSFVTGTKDSLAVKIETGIQKDKIISSTIAALKELKTNYNLADSEIAVLFPYTKHSSVSYYYLDPLKKALDEEGIPFSVITSTDHTSAKRNYSETEGVILSTIDSSLGLDFRAVVLAGLYPFDYLFDKGKKVQIVSWPQVSAMDLDYKDSLQSQMRKIYTACSRAREALYVLSDLNKETPMENIIRLS